MCARGVIERLRECPNSYIVAPAPRIKKCTYVFVRMCNGRDPRISISLYEQEDIPCSSPLTSKNVYVAYRKKHTLNPTVGTLKVL